MFNANIEHLTLKNKIYRKVIHTIPNKLQLVLMSLNPKEDIPWEIHEKVSQFIRVESGTGVIIINKQNQKTIKLKDGVSVIIPPNKWHYVKNTNKSHPLKLYTIYTPPEHAFNKKQQRQ